MSSLMYVVDENGDLVPMKKKWFEGQELQALNVGPENKTIKALLVVNVVELGIIGAMVLFIAGRLF